MHTFGAYLFGFDLEGLGHVPAKRRTTPYALTPRHFIGYHRLGRRYCAEDSQAAKIALSRVKEERTKTGKL
jgi:hypothetical protein